MSKGVTKEGVEERESWRCRIHCGDQEEESVERGIGRRRIIT